MKANTVPHLRGKTGVIVAESFGGLYEIVFDDLAIEPSRWNWRAKNAQLEYYENGIQRAIKCLN